MSLHLNKDQRSFTWTVVVLVVILALITFWHRPNTAINNTSKVVKKSFDYNAYLASLKIDPAARQALLKQVVDEQQVKADIEKELDINQKIILPAIEDSKLSVSGASSAEAMTEYLTAIGQSVSDYNHGAGDTSKELFGTSQTPSGLDNLAHNTDSLIQKLYAISVPKDAVGFHKAVLGIYESYANEINLAKSYNSDPTTGPWSHVYGDYLAINAQTSDLNKNFNGIDSKYHISQTAINPIAKSAGFIPTAHAQFGGAVIITKDIPQTIKDAVEQGLASAFANFATSYLNKLILTIESNYKIANFLYYSDALVRGEYVNDYLNKYVSSPLDRQLVTNFIPQFACSQAQDVKDALKAKADQYLGFDPENLSPDDPNFNEKLAKVGDFLSSPSGWQLYYEGIAQDAESEAQKAVDRELTSSGLKSPRDALGTQIAASLNSIAESETAAFIATLNLGASNPTNVVSKVVSSVTYNLFNKFVFRGATVYQEQKTCVPVPQVQPIIPAGDTSYQQPPTVPGQN